MCDWFWLYHRHLQATEVNSLHATNKQQQNEKKRKKGYTEIKCTSAHSKTEVGQTVHSSQKGHYLLTSCFHLFKGLTFIHFRHLLIKPKPTIVRHHVTVLTLCCKRIIVPIGFKWVRDETSLKLVKY